MATWFNWPLVLQWAEKWRALRDLRQVDEFQPLAAAGAKALAAEIARVSAEHFPPAAEKEAEYKPVFMAVFDGQAKPFRLRSAAGGDYDESQRLAAFLGPRLWNEHCNEIGRWVEGGPEYGDALQCTLSTGQAAVLVCARVS